VDIHTLRIIWFALIAVLWVGYLVLEGFDFGVGMLLPVLGRTETERRVLINTIGPVWDGNEVWLLTAGGATFAAFPLWYATMFSAFYLPLLLVLVGLIIRGVAFEYRGKIDDVAWRARWDWAIIIGSFVPSLLWGVAFGNIVHGTNIEHYQAGPFSVLIHALNPYSLLAGVCLVSVFLLHGALFIALKTKDDLRARALQLATTLSVPTLVIAGAWAIWTQLAYGKTWTWAPVLVAAVALVGVVMVARQGREGLGFLHTAVVIVMAVIIIFGSIFPNVLPIIGADSLTIDNASSSQNTLTVMTWVAVVMTPIVLAYTTWTYWVFRARLGLGDIPTTAGLTRQKSPA
jgi:cytochrome d ubiquinol oxidase subunit II